MLNYENQLNLGNIYSDCKEMFKEQRPEFLELLDKYIDINLYIPFSFKKAFYANTGRPGGCSLYGYISALIFQKIFNISTDTLLIIILNLSAELRSFCGIDKVPDASKWTRFKQDFCCYLEDMFINLGDAAFDAHSTYDFLLKEDVNGNTLFKKAFIPLNSRATSDKPNCPINENGIPLCPNDHSLPMLHGGMCHENERADRIKWRCPKINMVNGKWICSCENPCTTAKLGRTTYTTPSKNLRLYPGTIRGTEEWTSIYKIRGVVEQTINHIKCNMGIARRKTRNAKTTKADVFLAGIAQLFTVIISSNMSKTEYIRSIKKLAC